MVKDYTSLKIKEESETSRKNESLFAKLLENSSQPFGVGYPDGRLGRVNKAQLVKMIHHLLHNQCREYAFFFLFLHLQEDCM